jgi:hypothetical protein
MAKPSPLEVTKRLLILKYVVVQALALPPQDLLQKFYSQWSKEEQHKFSNDFAERTKLIVASLKSNKLWNLMTKEEQEFLQSTPPKVKFQYHLNAMWRLESVVALMWALGIINDFPPFDTQSNAELLNQIPHEDIDRFINNAKLLSDSVIEKKRSLAELWHWRSRTRQLVEEKNVPPAELGFSSFNQIVQEVANEAYKQGDLSQVMDNDFLAKDKAYRDLTNEEWSEVRSITMERHHALNWMCGYAQNNRWDKTPTDT